MGERRDLEPSMVQERLEQAEVLKIRFKEVHDLQKSYADKRHRDLKIQEENLLYLKMKKFQGGSKTQNLKKPKSSIWDHTSLWSRLGSGL